MRKRYHLFMEKLFTWLRDSVGEWFNDQRLKHGGKADRS